MTNKPTCEFPEGNVQIEPRCLTALHEQFTFMAMRHPNFRMALAFTTQGPETSLPEASTDQIVLHFGKRKIDRYLWCDGSNFRSCSIGFQESQQINLLFCFCGDESAGQLMFDLAAQAGNCVDNMTAPALQIGASEWLANIFFAGIESLVRGICVNGCSGVGCDLILMATNPFLASAMLIDHLLATTDGFKGNIKLATITEQEEMRSNNDSTNEKKFATVDLVVITGLKNDSVRKYGKLALNGRWPGRGKRGKQFSEAEAIAIVTAIRNDADEKAVRIKCDLWLDQFRSNSANTK